ncbi:hypothetical protein [Leptolyngbya sp. Cla-17]|nr:hypothetical protein [Leptolyngbya sp. Cla-17]
MNEARLAKLEPIPTTVCLCQRQYLKLEAEARWSDVGSKQS